MTWVCARPGHLQCVCVCGGVILHTCTPWSPSCHWHSNSSITQHIGKLTHCLLSLWLVHYLLWWQNLWWYGGSQYHHQVHKASAVGKWFGGQIIHATYHTILNHTIPCHTALHCTAPWLNHTQHTWRIAYSIGINGIGVLIDWWKDDKEFTDVTCTYNYVVWYMYAYYMHRTFPWLLLGLLKMGWKWSLLRVGYFIFWKTTVLYFTYLPSPIVK